MKLQKMLMF